MKEKFSEIRKIVKFLIPTVVLKTIKKLAAFKLN